MEDAVNVCAIGNETQMRYALKLLLAILVAAGFMALVLMENGDLKWQSTDSAFTASNSSRLD